MVDKDNGRQVTSSDIFIASFDGKTNYQITNTESVFEMYPEWSQDMSMVVCHSDDGRIFMTKLKFEE
jgi:Tol biopolymer transport system component